MKHVIRRIDSESAGTTLWFMCPGCKSHHMVTVGAGDGPRWTWNGSLDAPTLSPSILVTRPAVPNPEPGFEEFAQALRCHSFVRDGRIQFLSDCSHALAGQTVDLPEVPEA